LQPRQQAAFLSAGVVLVLLLLIVSGVTAAVAATAALIALLRHFAQTESDRQRRISENYSRAMGQLASEKMEERIAAIYTLERVARESPDDYWTIMAALVNFVRGRTLWNETSWPVSSFAWESNTLVNAEWHLDPPTDVAAVLAVIIRRSETDRTREARGDLRFDLSRLDLRGASLTLRARISNTPALGKRISKTPALRGHISNMPC
jgi:hypothetical protein